MEKIFQTNDTGREALAALRPFCEAASRRQPRWNWRSG
jgi:hypothetical protein